MKKLFTVLAVLLVASLAFAGFSGSVKAQYTFNFDEKTIAYAKPGVGSMDVDFKWDSQEIVLGGEGDVHIDFKASAGFKGWYGFGNNHADGYQPWLKYDKNLKNKETYVDFDYKTAEAGTFVIPFVTDKGNDFDSVMYALMVLKIDTFKIVGKDWTVDFLGSVGLNFAKSAIDTKKFNANTSEENVQNFSLDNSVKGKHNVAVTAFGYKFGFGLGSYVEKDYKFISDNWSDALTFATTVVTPEYDFNGVKLQAGAGYEAFNNDWALAASAKAAYATDNLSVSGAFDVVKKNAFKTIANEVAFNLAVAPVTFDAYWNNMDAKAKDKYYDYFDYDNAADYDYVNAKAMMDDHEVKFANENYLSAKVVVDVAKIAENVPVTVTVSAADIINEKAQNVSVEAETTIVPNFKFGVYFKDMFDFADDHRLLGGTVAFTGIQNVTLRGEASYALADEEDYKKLTVAAGVDYAHDLFTATADVALEKEYGKDSVIGAIVGAKSTTLVAGAELSAKAYFNLNDLDYLDTDDDNKLVLACKVSF